MPLVSVITATYNSAATLALTLRTLLAQDMGDFEALVVGDACTDNSEDVVLGLQDPRMSWMNLEQNSGSQAVPNNEGLRRARGAFIAFLGHDDLWFPNHLSSLLTLIQDGGADLVHALGAEIGPEGLRNAYGPPGRYRTYRDHFMPPSTWLFRREVVRDCGLWGLPQSLARAVDFDYLRRVYLAGKRIEFQPHLTVLKFPSRFFGTYSLRGEPPQAAYYNRMQEDVARLRVEVLTDLAVLMAKYRDEPVNMAFRRAFRILGRWVFDAYGRERWPLSWRFQRMLRKGRRLRGLPPS